MITHNFMSDFDNFDSFQVIFYKNFNQFLFMTDLNELLEISPDPPDLSDHVQQINISLFCDKQCLVSGQ